MKKSLLIVKVEERVQDKGKTFTLKLKIFCKKLEKFKPIFLFGRIRVTKEKELRHLQNPQQAALEKSLIVQEVDNCLKASVVFAVPDASTLFLFAFERDFLDNDGFENRNEGSDGLPEILFPVN